jgi:transposase-like protein
MHVLDYVLDRLSGLFRFNRYSLVEKAYSVLFHVVGLSLRDVSDRYYLTNASRESVRRWFHRFSRLFSVEKKFRNTIAVDETVVKIHGLRAYVWSAVDVDSGEILAIYASRGRNMLIALKFLRMVMDRCINKPLIVVDRGPWYRWALERLGLKYMYQTFGIRNSVERFFGYIKQRTRKFYNNINSWKTQSIEDYATAIAIIRNILTAIKIQGGVLLG